MVQQLNAAYLMGGGASQSYQLLRRAHYEIDIDGVNGLLLAQDVTIPRYELESVEVFHYNSRVKVPSGPNPGDMRVEFMDCLSPNVVDDLWAWFKKCYDPDSGAMKLPSEIKKVGRVFLYAPDNSLVRTWTCYGMWPKNSPAPEEAYSYRAKHEIVTIGMTFSVDAVSLGALGAVSLLASAGGGVGAGSGP